MEILSILRKLESSSEKVYASSSGKDLIKVAIILKSNSFLQVPHSKGEANMNLQLKSETRVWIHLPTVLQ